MKTTITPAERLQLIGLEAMAQQHNKALQDIEATMLALLAIEDDDKAQGVNRVSEAKDWVGEAIYNECGIPTMLKRLGIGVAKRK